MIMDKSVFISRDLSVNSPFRCQLEAKGFKIIDRSLLEFQRVSFNAFPTTDWIFFYSRKAVDFFLSQLENIPKDLKIAAFGSGTAEALNKHKVTPDFTGTGEGSSTLTAFLKVAGQQPSVLFPQARNSRRTIEKLAGDQLISFPLIVYNNIAKTKIEASAERFLVFTSPLNVQAYFEHHNLRDHQQIIVIGKTTGAALEVYGIEDFKVAEVPSEEGLVGAVLGSNRL